MNLTDYPTPQLDEFKSHWTISRRRTKQATFAAEAFKRLAQLEREAAAWKEVAEAIHSASNLDELQAAHEAFDALKSQLNETKP